MADLTDRERELIARGWEKALVRPVSQWLEILSALPPHDAATRILGDIVLYRPDAKKRGAWGQERRDGFLGDVQQLANVLEAMRELGRREADTKDAA